MQIVLKSVRIHASLSEETTAFTATLYVDGAKIGIVSNHGTGGPNCYGGCSLSVIQSLEAQAKAKLVADGAEDWQLFEPLDWLVTKCLADFELTRSLKSASRTALLFQIDGDGDDYFRTLKIPAKGTRAGAIAFVADKYGSKLSAIVKTNGKIDAVVRS